MEVWMKNLLADIERIAGPAKLSHYQVMILPQILADFHKMLTDQPAGKSIREQYRMEDGSMEIELVGSRMPDAGVKVTDARAYRV